MKHFKLKFSSAAVLVFSLFHAVKAMGQCLGTETYLTHTSGTMFFGCTEVTVTSDGYASSLPIIPPCWTGNYLIGHEDIPGSYTFSFSEPVQEVTIDVQFLDNWPSLPGAGTEEMAIDVNGVFYPITSPGTTVLCFQLPIMWPPGTLRAPIDGEGGSDGIVIPGPIYSIKVADNIVAGIPLGITFNISFCCLDCKSTDAGTINSNEMRACIDEAIAVSSSENNLLETDDILQYLLFSDPNSPNTSILASSNTPSFSFNPVSMTAGATYYIAAIAGNELNGNVDILDPCWDISNIIEVVWQPKPTVVFTSDVQCLMADGLYDIKIDFTGTPPFHLTGQVVLGGNVLTTFDNTYNFNSEVMVLYLPPTTPNGPLIVEALSLSDAYCTCN